MSVSNRFITWDLSTSDLTRDVNPNIEGIMQHLVLSPDNKWAAAYTNNNQVVSLENEYTEGNSNSTHQPSVELYETHLKLNQRRF